MVEAGVEKIVNGRRKWRANVGVGSIDVVEYLVELSKSYRVLHGSSR